jgi:sulfate permease, SulP family
VHSEFLVLVTVVLAPWAEAIPLSALAAILFTVAWNMSDIPHCIGMLRRAATADRLLLAVTFLLTVFVDIVVGVSVGVVFAALLFMQRMSESVSLQEHSFNGDEGREPPESAVALPANALVYRIEGPMFFGAAEKLERVLERAPLGITAVVLRFGAVPFVDATGMQTLTEVVQRFRKHGVRVLLCGVHSRLAETLRSGGVLELVGEENVCSNMRDVSKRLA